MIKLYEKYRKLDIDASLIELQVGDPTSDYFCTPKGAKVIGWAGVDGIHVCFVRGFGEMVFAVSPMNLPGDYVHPIAKDFEGFIGLLLACGDIAAMEQAHRWDEQQFDAFMVENQPTQEQKAVLDSIREQLSVPPMEYPFAYIKHLQAQFDYSRLRFPDDYNEYVSSQPETLEWKVHFEGGFGKGHARERAGSEIAIGKWFKWGEDDWYVPAAYSCSRGLVVEFFKKIEPEKIQAFIDKYRSGMDESGDVADDVMQQLQAENPTDENFNATVLLNGKTLTQGSNYGTGWNPFVQDGEENDAESKMILEHYGLDPQMGWMFYRSSFPWVTKRKPKIAALSMTVMQSPIAIYGERFRVTEPGQIIHFTHPITGVDHTIAVQECEQQTLTHESLGGMGWIMPSNYTLMDYVLAPDISGAAFLIKDCVQGDAPVPQEPHLYESQSLGVSSIGIIGGADGPTTIFVGAHAQGKRRAACSSLHFEPVADVEWRMMFYEKMREDITVELIK